MMTQYNAELTKNNVYQRELFMGFYKQAVFSITGRLKSILAHSSSQ